MRALTLQRQWAYAIFNLGMDVINLPRLPLESVEGERVAIYVAKNEQLYNDYEDALDAIYAVSEDDYALAVLNWGRNIEGKWVAGARLDPRFIGAIVGTVLLKRVMRRPWLNGSETLWSADGYWENYKESTREAMLAAKALDPEYDLSEPPIDYDLSPWAFGPVCLKCVGRVPLHVPLPIAAINAGFWDLPQKTTDYIQARMARALDLPEASKPSGRVSWEAPWVRSFEETEQSVGRTRGI